MLGNSVETGSRRTSIEQKGGVKEGQNMGLLQEDCERRVEATLGRSCSLCVGVDVSL